MSIITLKQKRDLIVSIFGEGVDSSNGKDIAVFCPVCRKSPKAKKKRKLSVSIEEGIYHCWVCESKGKNLLRFVRINVPSFRDLEKIKHTFKIKTEDGAEEESSQLTLPHDFKLVVLSKSRTSKFIKTYLTARGMSEKDLYKFKVGYSFMPSFRNRAIFVSLDEHLSLNYYVTRVCDDTMKFAKYRNCDISKKDIIFNENTINWKKPIILVEGIFDAVKAGNNAVPILGSWMDASYTLFKKIIENKTDVVLGLDPDAKDKEIKIAKNFLQHGVNVRIINNIKCDLGTYSKKEVKNLIHDSKRFDNIERMRYLIGGIKSGSMY